MHVCEVFNCLFSQPETASYAISDRFLGSTVPEKHVKNVEFFYIRLNRSREIAHEAVILYGFSQQLPTGSS